MPAPHQLPRALVTVARTFGARGTVLRAAHELRRKTSRFRGAPHHAVTPPGSHDGRAFRVDAERLRSATDRDVALWRGDRVLHGEYEAYRWDWRPFPRDPAGWTRHPVTGRPFSASDAWWRVSHLDPAAGDIKDLWEPARFAWGYDLVRAFLLTGDDRYAAAFHQRLAEWLAASPPFRGPHWSCGQETAIRAVALLYAEANLASAPSSTPAATARLEGVLAASGERIADALGYAVSQRNNHAISEAAGLVVLGSRFRGQHPEAGQWLERGTAWLERLIREQFAEDGWYVQHSFTYCRLALDQCVAAQRALGDSGASLSPAAVARLAAAVGLIVAVMDAGSGVVPNHGANDGAFVHPITLAGYRDFRPIVTAAGATFGVPLPEPVAHDPEVLAWLGLERPAPGPPLADGVWAGRSGWAIARVGDAAVFVRAGHYRSRPGHLDPLHVDVRRGGREVIVDAGTFAYNAPPPWRNGLATAHVHNGPVLDDREPGLRGPRFLWYAWPAAEVAHVAWDGGVATITAEVPGRLRRVIRVTSERVVVDDVVLTAAATTVRVRWLLHPNADPAAVRVHGESRLVAATEGATPGWFSPRYGERLPSRYVEVSGAAARDSRLVTEFTLTPTDPS